LVCWPKGAVPFGTEFFGNQNGRQGRERQNQALRQSSGSSVKACGSGLCAAANRRTGRGFQEAARRRLRARMDKPKAVTAAAHKLARLIHTMLTKGEEYTDQGQDGLLWAKLRFRSQIIQLLKY
jgi:hypothetical protein